MSPTIPHQRSALHRVWYTLPLAALALLLVAGAASAFTITKMSTVDDDGNGLIDHIKVETDANVDDDTLGNTVADPGMGEPDRVRHLWNVTDHKVLDVVTTLGTGGVDDPIFYVQIDEPLAADGAVGVDGRPKEGDTDDKPTVTYEKEAPILNDWSELNPNPNVKDVDGNELASKESSASDGAGPAIVWAHANPGNDTVTVKLSEPVASVLATHYTYHDVNAAGASGFAGEREFQSGTDIFTDRLTSLATFDDLGTDNVSLKVSLKDTVGNGAHSAARSLSDTEGPEPARILTRDLDSDGYLDAIQVRFSENITDLDPFVLSHWTLGAPFGDGSNHPTSIGTGNGPDDAVIFLIFDEELNGLTGVTPTVEYTGPTGTDQSDRIKDLTGNALADFSTTAEDGAAPVILASIGSDQTETQDLDGDGFLDAVALRLSEDLDPATFVADDWSVDGYTLDDATLNGMRVTLELIEGLTPDTGVTPVVAYDPGTDDLLTDLAGNGLGQTPHTPLDGAAPQIVTFEAAVDDTVAVVEFSEGVDNGQGNALTTSDFQFTDAAGATSKSLSAVVHTADAAQATLDFSFTSGTGWVLADFGNDKIAFAADQAFDEAENAGGITEVLLGRGAAQVLDMTTVDQDGDGLLDGVRVTFDEDLDDPVDAVGVSFPPAYRDHWELTAVTGGYSYGVCTTVCIPSDVYTGEDLNDASIILTFPERTDVVVDTGNVLQAKYTGISETDALVDQDGVPVKDMPEARQVDDGVAPIILGAFSRDADKDGKLDHYLLTFSEPINDDEAFVASGWRVRGDSILGRDTDSALYDSDDGSTSNDRLILSFPEGALRDTGATPHVTYPTASDFGDQNGNALAPVGTGGVVERDGAPPILYRFTSEVGQAQATLKFSESVTGTGPGGSLGYPLDLTYIDSNPETAAREVEAISHVSGSDTVTLTFSRPFEGTGDFGVDTIVAKTSVFDANGLAHPAGLSTALRSESTSDDVPPAAVIGLDVDSVTSTSIRLVWTAPGDDGTGGGKVSGYLIKFNTTTFSSTQFDDQEAASVVLDPASLASPAETQTAVVSGLEPGTEYFFRVVAVDEADNRGEISGVISGLTSPPDTTPPASVTDLAVVEGSVTANSVRLNWTAPGDDGDAGDTVTQYVIRYGPASFTSNRFGEQTLAETVTFTPDLAAPGETQEASISGLDPGTEYHFAIVAEDEVPNTSGVSNRVSFTTGLDDTPPTGTLVISSATHTEATATTDQDPEFTWQGLTDDDSTITYYYVLNQDAGYTVDGTEIRSTTDTTAAFSNIPPGSWYFHVGGFSAGGFGGQATYGIIIAEADVGSITDAEIRAANKAIDTSVARNEEGFPVVTWSLPDDLPGTAAGVQVWRSDSPYTLLETVTTDFQSGTYTDSSGDATEGSVYLVTVFYDDGSGRFQAALPPSTTEYTGAPAPDQAPAEEEEDGTPWWIWVLVAVGVLLLIVLLVLLVARSGGRDEEDESDETGEDDLWVEPEQEEEPVEQEETHNMRCPQCGTQFSASGQRPVTTQCPGCGRKGVLR